MRTFFNKDWTQENELGIEKFNKKEFRLKNESTKSLKQTNVIYKRLVHTSIPFTFLSHHDLLTIVYSHNTRKSITLYVTIFLKCLFNLLTDSYIIISLVASSTTSYARRLNLYDIFFY